jgi:gamma-glutamyl-gamma-aminobutyrate hydrolase PuuD
MNRIGVTQRVECVKNYAERRDCLDQRWSAFVFALGCVPLPMSNLSPEKVPQLLDAFSLDAVLLSGGNSIAHLNPTADDAAPERDAFESALLDEALKRNIPVVGVCRGMQMINMYMGGALSAVSGHVAVRHSLSPINNPYPLSATVNSYHNWSIAPMDLAPGLSALAVDESGNIEAFQHKEKRLLGIMWHPEREEPFNPLDINLIKSILI